MADESAPNQPTAPTQAPSASEAPVATAPAPKTPPPRVDHLPPFKVLLHNDDVNDVEWVVRSIIALTPTPPLRAIELTMEAHESGVALLLVTHKERAELYQEQFLTKKLTVTIEPAE
ncbi:MAG: ATP-dependent Clp protease adaptor ClpS [Tepidisphaera sp.]|jgi:ATP-dependent Clp protease adaptor protein ClpS